MMYTMPKNLLTICVNFALATQQLFQKIFYRKFVHSIHTYINMSPLYKCPENKPSPAAVRLQARKIMQHTSFPRIFQYSVVIFIAYC